MSALIDMWSSEIEKLREKGESLLPTLSWKPKMIKLKSKSIESPLAPVQALASEHKSGDSEVVLSEPTIFMIMECFAPS
ncbi:hypothetical protein ACHQM5_023347 [Ranunculus cassubicifolius]